MVFLWTDEYRLGIGVIDAQHKWFVNTLEELEEALAQTQEIHKKVATVLNKLDAYAKFHFDTEEKYFDEFHYDGANDHKKEHQMFRERLAELRKQYEIDEVDTSFKLADYLEDWLLNHLATMDAKYVPCFKEHGLQ